MNRRFFTERVSWRERFEYLVDYLSEDYERSITDLSSYEGDVFQESITEIAAEIDRRIKAKKSGEQDVNVGLKSTPNQDEDATCPACGSEAEWKDDEDGKKTPDGGSYYCPLGCKVKE